MLIKKPFVHCFVLFVVLIFGFTTIAAQKRRTPPTPKVVTSSSIPNPADVKKGAENVSIQLKNVSKFIYVLGGIASGIEAIDRDPKATKADRDKNAANKQQVIQAIDNLRRGLAALETDFRTNASLKKFLPQIQGITDLATQSEDLATAGRFSEAGKPLLLAIEKLADTLTAMP